MTTQQHGHWLLSIRPALLASFLKQLLRIKRKVIATREGRFFVDPASHFGNTLIRHPPYEAEMTECVSTLLRPGDVFVDVGANEGYYSIIASRLVGDLGLVICVEPQSRLQDILLRNIAENSAFNIQLVHYAISDDSGVAHLSLLPDMNTGGSGLFRATKYPVPAQMVLTSTISRIIERFRVDTIRLMKIDIEGFEYEAIMGSQDMFLKKAVEHIALELHPDVLAKRGKRQADVLEFLHRVGYRPNPRFENLVLSLP